MMTKKMIINGFVKFMVNPSGISDGHPPIKLWDPTFDYEPWLRQDSLRARSLGVSMNYACGASPSTSDQF